MRVFIREEWFNSLQEFRITSSRVIELMLMLTKYFFLALGKRFTQ